MCPPHLCYEPKIKHLSNNCVLAPQVVLKTNSAEEQTRFAIFFTPRPETAWWRFGCAWLGRDAISNLAPVPDDYHGLLPAQWQAYTAVPRRYGFHATLKPPFCLARGCHEHDVYLQAATLAGTLHPVMLPRVKVEMLDGFVALRPRPASPALDAIAAQSVVSFDNLRAAPDAGETARRRQQGLSARQAALLAQWGYPYVFEEYRFHLTLTDRIPEDEGVRLAASLQPLVDGLNAEPLTVDALAVFVQRAGSPFRLARRYGFNGAVESYDCG